MNRKKIIKGICFVLIFLILFAVFQEILQAKWLVEDGSTSPTTTTWREYRSLDPDTVDVLFLGTSHVYSAVDPMYIYEKTGITSYVLGGPSIRTDLAFMTLEEAIKTQHPSVVCMDMSSIHFGKQQEEEMCHQVSDLLSFSKSKIEYAFNNRNEELTPLDVLIPFFRYHSRWSDLKEKDFKYITNDVDETAFRGHLVLYESHPTEYQFYTKKKYVLTDRNWDYMQRIKNLCDEIGAELVLFKVPSPTWYESQSQGAAEVAEMLGVPWYELFYEVDDIGLDLNTDFRDRLNHLNQLGAEKLSDYLVEHILVNYDLEDQRATNQRWNDDLLIYKNAVQEIREKYSERSEADQ